ncbi:DNA recombination protein RmuC [bacterium]|nr:DNA recombination protein RmuC [bacterium]
MGATLPLAVTVIISFVLGAAFVYLLLRNRTAVLEERQRGKDGEIERLTKDVEGKDATIAELQQQSTDQTARHRELEMEMKKEREAAGEKLELLEKAKQELQDVFGALARKALDSNTERSKEAVKELVEPLGESLKAYQKQLHEFEKNRAGELGSLTQQLRQLSEAEKTLHGKADDLIHAIRGRPELRGKWGEMQLRRVLELTGMVEHCDFGEQQTVGPDHDRPDVIVYLPGNRSIVIDAKEVSEAYWPVVEAKDEEARQKSLGDFVRKVRVRLKALGAKSYWQHLDGSPEFVVMFLPGESHFSAALEADPDLIEFGASERVIVAGPIRLIGLLWTIAYDWKQEEVAKNAQKISELGHELYERICNLGEHFEDLRKNLRGAVNAYDSAVGSLESRLLPQARRFRELGVGGKAEIEVLEPLGIEPRALSAPELVEGRDA